MLKSLVPFASLLMNWQCYVTQVPDHVKVLPPLVNLCRLVCRIQPPILGGGTPDADYYEIALVQYKEQMHSDLPATYLRGYVQLSTTALADSLTR